MDTKKLDTCSRDAISLLPDEVLGNILSSLSTKEAASTSLLSKKWRNVFALVHNLNFDDSDFMHPEEAKEDCDVIFRNFVDRTLALQCGSPIKKFSLHCYCYDDSDLAYVYRWICNAVERGVLELDVSLTSRPEFFLPCELFRSKTLVKLTLGTWLSLGKIPLDAYLPALKSLSIDSIFFDNTDLCDVFLAACPVLEELSVHHAEFVGLPLCLCSRSIKKLSVHYGCESEACFSEAMSFNAPSLVSFDYSDYALKDYLQVNLVSLVEARLDLRYSKHVKRPDLTRLIIGISNVETLHLSHDAVTVISGCVKHGLILPVFNNLVSLSFGSNNMNKRGWRLLPHLLKQSPKLETLIIQGLDSYTGDVTLCPFQVKVLRILNYGGTAQELKHLKSFIGEAECLKLVLVVIAEAIVVDDSIISQTYRDLTTLLGVSASPKCEIEVEYYT